MTKLEVDKEYWFKGKVIMIDEKDMAQPYKVQFGDWNTTWMPESIEVIPEREKATIPKEVADWIFSCKEYEYNLNDALDDGINDTPVNVQGWLAFPENQDTFARAWLDGYEVEKEQLYWVRDKDGRSLLYRGYQAIEISGASSVNYQENHAKLYTFTEKEIKDYDERYWAFAVPVEEER